MWSRMLKKLLHDLKNQQEIEKMCKVLVHEEAWKDPYLILYFTLTEYTVDNFSSCYMPSILSIKKLPRAVLIRDITHFLYKIKRQCPLQWLLPRVYIIRRFTYFISLSRGEYSESASAQYQGAASQPHSAYAAAPQSNQPYLSVAPYSTAQPNQQQKLAVAASGPQPVVAPAPQQARDGKAYVSAQSSYQNVPQQYQKQQYQKQQYQGMGVFVYVLSVLD